MVAVEQVEDAGALGHADGVDGAVRSPAALQQRPAGRAYAPLFCAAEAAGVEVYPVVVISSSPRNTKCTIVVMNTPSTTPSTAPSPVQIARGLLNEFREAYPAFRDYLPLAIGIDKQLIARRPELNRKVLRIALGLHTNSLRYLKGMEKAEARFDLDGNRADEVTEAHRTHASQILRERFKKAAEQRKAQREAEEAERKHKEKLNQLAAKFSRSGG
jgi:ProP effector